MGEGERGEEPSAEWRKLVDEQLFRFLVYLETRKASRLRYCISVLYISVDGGPDDDGHLFTTHVAELAARHLRATDVVAALAPRSIGVLLVDAETPTLREIFSRATEPVRAAPVTFGGLEWQLTLSAGGACYPQSATTEQELLRQAANLMTRARAEGGGRLHLPR